MEDLNPRVLIWKIMESPLPAMLTWGAEIASRTFIITYDLGIRDKLDPLYGKFTLSTKRKGSRAKIEMLGSYNTLISAKGAATRS
jgi:hypothetical protein